jgi:putative flippase GtrA
MPGCDNRVVAAPPVAAVTTWSIVERWLKFSAVGLIGIAVQSAVLAVMVRLADVQYLLATAFAVEAAIVHNFIWHCRWTWRDRDSAGNAYRSHPATALAVFLRFNLTTGAISIGGNLLCMKLLVGEVGLGILRANLAAIGFCSLINFVVADRFVFT